MTELVEGPVATFTWANGETTLEPLVPAGGGGWELIPRNPGRPDPWGQGWISQPVGVNRVTVAAPGLTLLGGEAYLGARRLPDGDWEILAPDMFHYPHRRNNVAVPGCEGWQTTHLFQGGDHVCFARFAPETDPWELGWQGGFDKAAKDKILSFLRTDLIAKYPFFDKLLGMYRWDSRVLGQGLPGTKTFPWLLYPENFMKRWTGQPGGVPAIRHPMGFGTRTPGGTLNNEHEAHDFHTLVEGLRSGSQATIALALYLIRYKVAYGLIDTDFVCVWKGRWRNENGDMVRGTVGQTPGEQKGWDAGLVWANKLTKGEDPILARGVQVRSTYLKTCPIQWVGGGGTRVLSHYLENLEHHYESSGDHAFFQQAVAQIHKAFQLVGNRNYFPSIASDTGQVTMCYEEGVHAAVARWIARSPALLGQYEEKLKEIVDHTLAHCVRSDGRVGYKWNPTGNEGTQPVEVVNRPLHPYEVVWAGDWNGGWLFGLREHCERWWPGRFSTLFDTIESYVATHGGAQDPAWDACYGPKGSGHEKEIGFVGQGLTHLW